MFYVSYIMGDSLLGLYISSISLHGFPGIFPTKAILYAYGILWFCFSYHSPSQYMKELG